MYHGFCVSCSSLPPPHTHTHLSTGMDLKKYYTVVTGIALFLLGLETNKLGDLPK